MPIYNEIGVTGGKNEKRQTLIRIVNAWLQNKHRPRSGAGGSGLGVTDWQNR